MLLLTARILGPGEFVTQPIGEVNKRTATVLLVDGRTVYVEVYEVVAAFEIEERTR